MSASAPIAVFDRWPQDDDELHEWVALVWGLDIPRKAICPGHCAPFDAFADAFFARSDVAVWKASRGLGGKSTLLGVLAASEMVILGAQVTVLGGSASQSQRVKEVVDEAWREPFAPTYLLSKDPTMFSTTLTNGAWLRALLASQTSVRGPHPQRLRLDEIDEMELDIFQAAQGQPMDDNKRKIASHTVASSTHQYPDRTMTAVLKEAAAKGWAVFEWCYRENLEDYGGWLTNRQVVKKRNEVSTAMWDVEFELQEPSFENRAIDVGLVEAAFDATLGECDGEENVNYIFEEYIHGRKYITATDWAKEQDWTIIATFLCDVVPWRCVAWRRVRRRPWPIMVGMLDDRLDAYPGWYVHDATGIGNVIADLISHTQPTYDADPNVVMVGARRTAIFADYVKAIENSEIRYPRIGYALGEHKYATNADLFGSGHPPDSIVAGALAWHMRDFVRQARNIMPGSVERDASPWRST